MSLESCYEGIAKKYHGIDSYKVVEEVERYRHLWKPGKVRVLLFAESHVRTSDEDFDHHWSYGSGRAYQGNFLRFVYCLANGEKDLVQIRSNKGTWQFWLLLSSCLNNPTDKTTFSSVLRKTTPDFNARMKKKIRLLEDLKKHGIWLLDASIVGVNEQKDPIWTRIVRHSWSNHTRSVLENLNPTPEHIIIVGEGVEKTLGDEVRGLGIAHSVVPQPQARLRDGYSNYHAKCFEICSRFRN